MTTAVDLEPARWTYSSRTRTSWSARSRSCWEASSRDGPLVISGLVYAELAAFFQRKDELDAFLRENLIRRESLSDRALFLAGRAWRAYRSAGGQRDTGHLGLSDRCARPGAGRSGWQPATGEFYRAVLPGAHRRRSRDPRHPLAPVLEGERRYIQPARGFRYKYDGIRWLSKNNRQGKRLTPIEPAGAASVLLLQDRVDQRARPNDGHLLDRERPPGDRDHRSRRTRRRRLPRTRETCRHPGRSTPAPGAAAPRPWSRRRRSDAAPAPRSTAGNRAESSSPTRTYSSMISRDTTTSMVPSRHAVRTRPGGPPKKTPDTNTLVSTTTLTRTARRESLRRCPTGEARLRARRERHGR